MKIIKVTSFEGRDIEMEDGRIYKRYSEDGWTKLMGDSEEPEYYPEELEESYQSYVKSREGEILDERVCEWKMGIGDYRGLPAWDTGCGEKWVASFTSPRKAGFNFCPICGARVVENRK